MSTDAAWAWTALVRTSRPGATVFACTAMVSRRDRHSSSRLGTSGATVSAVEYLLTGAALILFFVLLLALAEIIGFTPAYILAAAAITGLNTAYAAAFLKSWRRASFVGALLAGLYAVLYILISLEAFSLIIGSTLLFVALAAVMYATRHIDWGARSGA